MNYENENQGDQQATQDAQNENGQNTDNNAVNSQNEDELRLAAEDQGGQQNSIEGNTPNSERNQGAWNGQVGEGQSPEDQGGSLASDGPVSENEGGRGADLTDVGGQTGDSDFQPTSNNGSGFSSAASTDESSLDEDERSGGAALGEEEDGDFGTDEDDESSLDQDERSGGSVL